MVLEEKEMAGEKGDIEGGKTEEIFMVGIRDTGNNICCILLL